jgi:hypothetical protein
MTIEWKSATLKAAFESQNAVAFIAAADEFCVADASPIGGVGVRIVTPKSTGTPTVIASHDGTIATWDTGTHDGLRDGAGQHRTAKPETRRYRLAALIAA